MSRRSSVLAVALALTLVACIDPVDPTVERRAELGDAMTVVHHDPARTDDGYTLIHPLGGTELIWLNMDGEVARVLEMPFVITHAEQTDGGQIAMLAQNAMLLVDPDGEIQRMDWPAGEAVVHHELFLSDEGTFFTLIQELRPDLGDIQADSIIEVDASGAVVWRWDALDYFDPETDREQFDPPHPALEGVDWLHLNSLDRFADGDLLVSVRNLDRIIRVDYPSGEILWSWGGDQLGHQHAADVLDNGNVLLFDNGFHREPDNLCFLSPCASRAIEVDPLSGEIVWEYESMALFSRGFGDADRLANGNTLITFGQAGPARVLEVTPDGDVVWSLESGIGYVIPNVLNQPVPSLYRAQRVDALP